MKRSNNFIADFPLPTPLKPNRPDRLRAKAGNKPDYKSDLQVRSQD
jgi:hypothetical protein